MHKRPAVRVREGYRFCWGCHEELELTERYFSQNVTRTAGFGFRCRLCEAYRLKLHYARLLRMVPCDTGDSSDTQTIAFLLGISIADVLKDEWIAMRKLRRHPELLEHLHA